LKDLHARLASAQLSERAAKADTPGAAWAVSHYARIDVVPPPVQPMFSAACPWRLSGFLSRKSSAFAKSASNELRSSLLCRAQNGL
jgi:hypothetical protein